MQYLWEVWQPRWPQVDRYQHRWHRSSTVPLVSCVRGGVPQGVERQQHRPWKLCEFFCVLHVSRAHFYADAVRDEHVRLPDEDPLAKEPGVRGKQRKMMYGSIEDRKLASWCTVTNFSQWADVEAKACTESVARCIRTEQSRNFGPRVVTVLGSFLGRTLTMRQ